VLSRSQPLRRVAMTRTGPKPGTEEKDARAIVRERSGGWCEMRLTGCAGRATDFSHRIGQGVGGPDTPSNAMDACRICHSWCHARPAEAKDLGLMLESWQDPTLEPVAYQNAGLVMLDDRGGLWPVD
jgi:hypothetical protein